ncbi:MAG: winged helix-turn-helix domain-containing protein [Imperialibacter sp.]|uniref:winged helix-turn-helix domain-containing protein n=1 Tax=Imperialibacter sp. TaxID=2038411 RepID=UPI0032EF97E4
MKRALINHKYVIDFQKNEMYNRTTGEVNRLEPRLAKLLAILLETPHSVVPRSVLVNRLWGNYGSGEELLTQSISTLRTQFKGEQLIKTVPKVGYLFDGNLQAKHLTTKSFLRPFITSRWLLAFLCVVVIITIKAIIWPHH